MSKKTLRDLDLQGKRVLMRVDFNVPQQADGSVGDDRRIRAALPTIGYALDHGGAVILMSHLGRPKGDPTADRKFKLDGVAVRLGDLLPGVPIRKADEVVGPQSARLAGELRPGEILLLENLRFHKGEQKGEIALAKQLRALADVYVNDAFGTCHRADASMYAVPAEFPPGTRVVGFLVERELAVLAGLLAHPQKPLVAVMGGAKVSDKIGLIAALLQRVDRLLIGGAMTYTFRMALGESIGDSLVEGEKLDLARKLMQQAGSKLVLPVDHLIADKPAADAVIKVVDQEIPNGWMGMDIGPKTIALYRQEIARGATVLWNGPMGKFEDAPFRAGTWAIAEALANHPGTTIVGGGESAEAVEAFGLADQMTHVSTGGGAFLEYLEGKPFQSLTVIDEK